MTAIDLDSAATFLETLSGGDGWTCTVLFQTFDDRPEKRPWLGRVLIGTLRDRAGELQRLNAQGACIAVAVNVLRGRRRLAAEVMSLRALFIDCDGDIARELALPPSLSVLSKNGPHHYWLLHPGEPVSLFAAAQRQLAAFYGADPMVCDPSRVMRVPGFLHQKETPFLMRLAAADASRRYSLRDILLPHEGVHPAQPAAAGRNGDRTAPPEAINAFRRWAASAPRYEGTRNATAFVMAAEGFKTGITPAAVDREVRAYCDRAGIPDEARAVLRSARRRSRR